MRQNLYLPSDQKCSKPNMQISWDADPNHLTKPTSSDQANIKDYVLLPSAPRCLSRLIIVYAIQYWTDGPVYVFIVL
jgi:hypothetical protein